MCGIAGAVHLHGPTPSQDLLRRMTATLRHRGPADEAVLHLYETHGTDALRFLRGMFAFALWDGRARTLFVARDRLGKKPLVYYHDDDTFVFASEPKAILQHPRVRAEADPEALHHFLAWG